MQVREQASILPNIQSQESLQWVKNDRTAGSIPVWVSKPKSKFSEVLAYQITGPEKPEISAKQDDSFGFDDLVDMINPLQHIPLLNVAYRAITGDQIKPIGKILGGALYGGPIGAGSSLVDAIVTEKTGKDIGGNALALLEGQSELNSEKAKSVSQAYERIQLAESRTAGTIIRYG